jgi:hypothetical protein
VQGALMKVTAGMITQRQYWVPNHHQGELSLCSFYQAVPIYHILFHSKFSLYFPLLVAIFNGFYHVLCFMAFTALSELSVSMCIFKVSLQVLNIPLLGKHFI